MRKRKWDAKSKALIVIEGIKGKSVGEICTEHQISQSQYHNRYNEHYLHSALGYQTPRQFERDYDNCHSPPFIVA
jgi:transposase-like protein